MDDNIKTNTPTPTENIEPVSSEEKSTFASNMDQLFDMAQADNSNGVDDSGNRYFLNDAGKPLYETEKNPTSGKDIVGE